MCSCDVWVECDLSACRHADSLERRSASPVRLPAFADRGLEHFYGAAIFSLCHLAEGKH